MHEACWFCIVRLCKSQDFANFWGTETMIFATTFLSVNASPRCHIWFTASIYLPELSLTDSLSIIFINSISLCNVRILTDLTLLLPSNSSWTVSHTCLAVFKSMVLLKIWSVSHEWKQVMALSFFSFSSSSAFILETVRILSQWRWISFRDHSIP